MYILYYQVHIVLHIGARKKEDSIVCFNETVRFISSNNFTLRVYNLIKHQCFVLSFILDLRVRKSFQMFKE